MLENCLPFEDTSYFFSLISLAAIGLLSVEFLIIEFEPIIFC